EHWFRRCADAFERLYLEGETRAKIMAIAVHPYISGQPFRIHYLERVYEYINRFAGVLHWNGAEIYDWYNRLANVHSYQGGPPVLQNHRFAYSPISGRAPLPLSDGKGLAVWVIVNVEEWDIRDPMPRTVLSPPAGGSPMPDIPNWAWHEYGNRVGFWRLLK